MIHLMFSRWSGTVMRHQLPSYFTDHGCGWMKTISRKIASDLSLMEINERPTCLILSIFSHRNSINTLTVSLAIHQVRRLGIPKMEEVGVSYSKSERSSGGGGDAEKKGMGILEDSQVSVCDSLNLKHF